VRGGTGDDENGPRAHFLFWRFLLLVKRRLDKQGLIALLEPPLQALGFDLADLEVHAGRPALLRVYIDRDPGVTLADCELVGRQLGTLLDVEDPLPGSYVLEVSSPGLDRRLRTPEQFLRFVGREVRIDLKQPRDGRRRLKGTLVAVEASRIRVGVDQALWEVELADIGVARLVPEQQGKARVAKR
jgi:ribosome maturation factor RimP